MAMFCSFEDIADLRPSCGGSVADRASADRIPSASRDRLLPRGSDGEAPAGVEPDS